MFQGTEYFLDNPTGCGSTGGYSDGLCIRQRLRVQLIFSFHMKYRFSHFSDDLGQSIGIPAVAPPDHNHCIGFCCEFSYLALPSFGGITNGIEQLIMGRLFLRPIGNTGEKCTVLGGLSDDYRLFKYGKRFKLFLVINNNTVVPGVSKKPDDFRMVLISDDNGLISLARIFSNDGLNFDNMGAGGIDN